MNISLSWLNSLLVPGDLSADEAERVLTFVGFPIESKKSIDGKSAGAVARGYAGITGLHTGRQLPGRAAASARRTRTGACGQRAGLCTWGFARGDPARPPQAGRQWRGLFG